MRAALLLPLLLAGCGGAADPEPDSTPTLITRIDQVDAAVDKIVTLRGEFRYSKIQWILNVDVDGHDLGPDVTMATATGLLRKSVTTQEELDREFAKRGIFATRGAGTYYHLLDRVSGRLAKAAPWPGSP